MSPSRPWLPLADVETLIPLMEEQGVSIVARSPRGFIAAYRRAGGRPEHLGTAVIPGGGRQKWVLRRNAFVARHLNQGLKQETPWWTEEGLPTRRHLALIAWAYTPTPRRLATFLRTL